MKNYIPAFIWASIIFWLSAGPGVSLPESWSDFFAPDKVGHMIFYMILSILLLWGNQSREKSWNKRNAFILVTICAFYGLLLEIMQYAFFPSRYFEVLDIIANIIGSFTGLYLYKYFFIKKL